MDFGFWNTLPRPFMALAPMSGYTDTAYRLMAVRYGSPDVMYTEFVPANGLASDGRANLLHFFHTTPAQRPLVAQLYGGEPGHFYAAARVAATLGVDGIDINMGCPAKAVVSRKGGAALIGDLPRAREIIDAAKDGAGGLPVSVKTRLAPAADNERWLTGLLEAQPAALAVHARARCDTYKSPARWGEIARLVQLARVAHPDPGERPLIIGNGDVKSLAQARQRAAETGCDGVMLGRACYGNPWLFNREYTRDDLPRAELLEVMLEHARVFREHNVAERPLEFLRKHFKAYVHGFKGATAIRARVMAAEDYAKLEAMVREAQRRLAPDPVRR